MAYDLEGKRIAIMATNGVEEVEFTRPFNELRLVGAEVFVVSDEKLSIRSWQENAWSHYYKVDSSLDSVTANMFDALILPGGVMNADLLRGNDKAIAFVRHFFEQGKPVAAICHAPWLLIEAGAVQGRTLTSYPSLKTDLRNAGANWIDEEVVVDNGLVTSRMPADLDAFCKKTIEEIAEGKHRLQKLTFLKEI